MIRAEPDSAATRTTGGQLRSRTAPLRIAHKERFGLIRFGSRTDLFLPKGVSPLVAVGQRMIGGETVMADLASTEGPRRGETQ